MLMNGKILYYKFIKVIYILNVRLLKFQLWLFLEVVEEEFRRIQKDDKEKGCVLLDFEIYFKVERLYYCIWIDELVIRQWKFDYDYEVIVYQWGQDGVFNDDV